MRNRKNGLAIMASNCLMTVALATQLPLAAWADDVTTTTTSTTATTAAIPTTDSPTETSGHTMLYGSANDYASAMQKLSKRQQLTAEEYRSLNIGTAGMEADQTFFQKIAKITKVYKDSPADKAGIRPGDKMLMTEPDPDEAKERANPEVPLFRIKFKKVGTPVDITLLRHNQPVKMTLITMNIEDIEEPGIRKMLEKMISELNYPQDGTYSGPSIHKLTPIQDSSSTSTP
jgi:C-terminal processing protease CtpA/Prc